jgi:hypothetical protein
VIVSTTVAPWDALAVDTSNGYHFLQDIDGGTPRGRCRWVRQRPPSGLKKTSMVGLLGGALLVGLAVSTTEVEEDVDGRPPGGRCR